VASSITPSTNNQVVVTGVEFVDTAGATYTINSGMTVSDSKPWLSGNYRGSAMAYIIQTTATAIQPTWTDDQATVLAPFCGIGSFK
jgi:hypothetical protein